MQQLSKDQAALITSLRAQVCTAVVSPDMVAVLGWPWKRGHASSLSLGLQQIKALSGAEFAGISVVKGVVDNIAQLQRKVRDSATLFACVPVFVCVFVMSAALYLLASLLPPPCCSD